VDVEIRIMVNFVIIKGMENSAIAYP